MRINIALLTCFFPFVACGAVALADEAEDRAEAAIKKIGGKVTRDDKIASNPVAFVNMSATKVTDLDLVHFRSFKKLRRLNLTFGEITDQGLENLQELKELEWLEMNHVPVSDNGLAFL